MHTSLPGLTRACLADRLLCEVIVCFGERVYRGPLHVPQQTERASMFPARSIEIRGTLISLSEGPEPGFCVKPGSDFA